ncbi:MAG: DUF4870 domain-containing protein [Pseudonocardia sp.]
MTTSSTRANSPTPGGRRPASRTRPRGRVTRLRGGRTSSTRRPGPGYQGYPPPGPPYQGPPGTGALSPQDERTWAMAAHLSALIGMIIGLSFVGPLVVMLVQGPKSPYVWANAVEALNFNLSILIYGIVSSVLIVLLIGIPMLFAVGIAWLVFTIIAGVKTSNGEPYRYPLTIRLVT